MRKFGWLARTFIPLVADLAHLHPRTDPDFGTSLWCAGLRAGTLLEAKPIRPVGLVPFLNPARAWRVRYVTTRSDGKRLTATGAVFRSLRPWNEAGPRPTVAFAPSTQGVAPRCDPSYSCTVGLALRRNPLDFIAAYEQPAINMLLASGMNVVLTDYPRDPEDNVQLYCDHQSAARALADAVRAASSLGVHASVLGLWGYSQGAGAVGAWLERPEYAPEIVPSAAVIGAPPADLSAMLEHVDGALASIVILYAVAGLLTVNDAVAEELLPELSNDGLEAVLLDARVCALGAVFKRPWAHTSSWTASALPMAELLQQLPHTAEFLRENKLGQRRPLRIPLKLWGSPNDDLVPFSTVEELGLAWQVEVEVRKLVDFPGRTGLNHMVPYFQHLACDIEWLFQQLQVASR